MCLGIPGRIVSIRGKAAVVEFWGVSREVDLGNLTEPVAPGDYIINHAGVAVRRIASADVLDTLGLYETILCEAGEDPIAREIACELGEAEELELELV